MVVSFSYQFFLKILGQLFARMEDINMSKKKKGLGGLLGLAALAGGVAAVVSYLYKYQKFSEEVDQDFTDVLESANEVKNSAKRSYTTLKNSQGKEEIKAAAKDLGYAAKNLAVDTKNLAIDAGKDAYRTVKEALNEKLGSQTSDDVDPDDICDEDLVDDEDVEIEFYSVEDEKSQENEKKKRVILNPKRVKLPKKLLRKLRRSKLKMSPRQKKLLRNL